MIKNNNKNKIVSCAPFKVISNITNDVYTVTEVEVKNGKLVNYIIDDKAWELDRFRAESFAIKESIIDLDDLFEIKNTLTYLLNRIDNVISEIFFKEE